MTARTDWRHNAVCREEDPELFFPRGETGPSVTQIDEAKTVCHRCPVMDTCLRWALTTRQDAGVWGGRSESERRRILRRMTVQPGLSLEQAIVGPRAPQPLAEVFAQRIAVEPDGHTRWLLKSTTISVDGRNRTPRQIAFFLGHGRQPEGVVRATCGTPGCLTLGHIADEVMRRERDLGLVEAS
jgi:WhiB family redox-sensing transcriptional regulator